MHAFCVWLNDCKTKRNYLLMGYTSFMGQESHDQISRVFFSHDEKNIKSVVSSVKFILCDKYDECW